MSYNVISYKISSQITAYSYRTAKHPNRAVILMNMLQHKYMHTLCDTWVKASPLLWNFTTVS